VHCLRQAFLLFNKLSGYMMNNWFTSPITTAPFTGCDPSMKRNTDGVMNVMVTIRESNSLASRYFRSGWPASLLMRLADALVWPAGTACSLASWLAQCDGVVC
jgi:hypothetical protein